MSIWELRASADKMQELLGNGEAMQVGKVVLMRNRFAFDEALCWCRAVGGEQQRDTVIELHMHGGFGVAAALRDFLHRLGWVESEELLDMEREGAVTNASNAEQAAFLQATSPLAARIFSARLATPWNTELKRISRLPEPQRQQQVAALRKWNAWGQVLAQPPTVLIAGPPNAGKSTLFNAWLQERRVTANEAAGTTRDLVAAPLQLGLDAEAFVVELVDSAGVWEQAQGVDKAAVKMTEQALTSAWRVIWVFDAAEPPSAQILDAVARRTERDPLVVNRCDRKASWTAEEVLPRPFLRGEPQSQVALLQALEQRLLGQLGSPPPVGQLVAVSLAERDALEAL
ncbi:MAG: hypothetical protein GY747_13385 [Planctomycetes bacterium]|nr:hypothetical protein [Planctomycetota bacterium]MCP4770725.1 hypothetical protein [Planctomycetota bacterium]MCP4861440.1 hypothetical protein [Planctomycetota bacterium]